MNKTEMTRRCRQIVAAYEDGEQLMRQDAEWVLKVLATHPKADEKFGCGVTEIRVGRNRYGTRSFFVVRTDGTRDDFSVGKCGPLDA